jgi:DNA-binding transcriptional LysR family regulator
LPVQIRHINYVIAAADHGSFRRAAAFLGVQESAVSRRIRDLEDRLGAPLFTRSAGGVQLTQAGRQFVQRGRKALSQIGMARAEVSAIGRGEDGEIRIGIFSSLASGFLADLFQAFGQRHKAVKLSFVEGNPAEHVAAVRQHQLDVAFLTGLTSWPDCQSQHLWSERIFAVLPLRHAHADDMEVGFGDLAGETFIVSESAPGEEIHDYLVQRMADLGHHPDIQQQAVGRDTLMQLVALGRGLTVTSEATTGTQFPGVVFRPIVGEILPFRAVWASRNDNPAFLLLLDLARSMARVDQPSGINVPRKAAISHAEPLRTPDPSR